MYAVIETGGKQYRVSEGDVITVEKLKGEAGEKIEFEKVMLIGEGDDLQVGTPYLDAAKVYGSIVESGKGEKVIIFKYKAKKDYRKKQGHRQPYTTVQIDGLSSDGKTSEKKAVESVGNVTEVKAEAVSETQEKTEAVEKKPTAEKKPAVKKTAEEKAPAEKKTAAKKTTEEKAPAEKKPAAKKEAVKEEDKAE